MKWYRKILDKECEQIGNLNESSAVQRLDELKKMLHKATEYAVQFKLIKLKGPTWITSPTVKKTFNCM